MIKIINSTITLDRTESSTEEVTPKWEATYKRFLSVRVMEDKTSNALSSESHYQLKPPTNVDVIGNAVERIPRLQNKDVQRQTAEILAAINACIFENIDISKASNRLSQLHLTEQEDSSALVEWNFESFRFGFSIEPKEEETSYYMVSEDKSEGSFQAETHRLRKDYRDTICRITDYVIRNT